MAVHQEQNATNIALRQPYAEEHPVSEAGPVTEENSDSESCPETEAGSDPEAGSNADGGQAEYVQPVLAAILISAVPLGLAAEDRTFSTPEEAIEAAFSREPMCVYAIHICKVLSNVESSMSTTPGPRYT